MLGGRRRAQRTVKVRGFHLKLRKLYRSESFLLELEFGFVVEPRTPSLIAASFSCLFVNGIMLRLEFDWDGCNKGSVIDVGNVDELVLKTNIGVTRLELFSKIAFITCWKLHENDDKSIWQNYMTDNNRTIYKMICTLAPLVAAYNLCQLENNPPFPLADDNNGV